MGTENGTQARFKTAQGAPIDMPDPLGLGEVVTEHQREYPVGTRRLVNSGYITVKVDAGWVSEARLVIERHLGRPLTDNEEARHRAGASRWDNRLEALELWRDGRPARMPRRAAAAKRTNWKGLYLDAASVLEDVCSPGSFRFWELDDDQRAAVQRVLDARP